MRRPWIFRWTIACAALLANPLWAIDESSAVSPQTLTFQGSAQGRPLSVVGPNSALKAPRGQVSAPDVDTQALSDWAEVTVSPSPKILDLMSAGDSAPDAQTGCVICLEGDSHVQWLGDSGSFQVERLSNHNSSGTSGSLRLKMALSSTPPVFGNSINSFQMSDNYGLSPLQANYYYSNIDTGPIAFYNSTIPAGTYYLFMMALEYEGGTWYYTDFIDFPSRVTCDGSSGCSSVAPPTGCNPDANTLCLYGNRFEVRATYTDYSNNTGPGNAVVLTADSGYFWFFSSSNVEAVGKVVSFCSLNGSFGFYSGGMTDVGVVMTVRDTVANQTQTFTNVRGHPFNMISSAFHTCP